MINLLKLIRFIIGICLLLLNFTCKKFNNSENDEVILPKQPNILWISCEDISPRLGCCGDHVAQTPNLDELANQGVK